MGIDPGISGGLGLITLAGGWRFLDAQHMPSKNVGKTKDVWRVDAAAVAEIVREWNPSLAVIENVQPMPATKGDRCRACGREKEQMPARHAFSFGHSCAVPLAVLEVLGVDVLLVPPVVWKRAAGLPKREGRSDTEVKGESRRLAWDLWPDAPLHRARDHALAEALLIARFGVGRQGTLL